MHGIYHFINANYIPSITMFYPLKKSFGMLEEHNLQNFVNHLPNAHG